MDNNTLNNQPQRTDRQKETKPWQKSLVLGLVSLLVVAVVLVVMNVLAGSGVSSFSNNEEKAYQNIEHLNNEVIYPGGWGVIDLQDPRHVGSGHSWILHDDTAVTISHEESGKSWELTNVSTGYGFNYDDTVGFGDPPYDATSGEIPPNSNLRPGPRGKVGVSGTIPVVYIFGKGELPPDAKVPLPDSSSEDSSGNHKFEPNMLKFQLPNDVPEGKITVTLFLKVSGALVYDVVRQKKVTKRLETDKMVNFTVVRNKEAFEAMKEELREKTRPAGIMGLAARVLPFILVIGIISTIVNLYKGIKGYHC